MRLVHRGRLASIIVASLVATLSETGLDVSFADSINEGVFSIDSSPYGITYEDWTIRYWQWIIPKPVDINPMTDETGEYCNVDQGSLPVFFLATGGGGKKERICTVPADKAILVAPSVVECSFAELPAASTEEELHVCAEEDQSSNPILFASVDGREISDLQKYRVHSRAFDVVFPENALWGAAQGPTRAVSDGYWLILEPLTPGEHEIHIKSILTDPTSGILFFDDDVKYHLTVAHSEDGQAITLQGPSTSDDFELEVGWTPDDIGSENIFAIKIMDANGQQLEGATYDVMLFKGDQHLDETHRTGQTASTQEYIFDEAGSYSLRIENIDGSGASDGISIPIQVTPEFDTIVVILMTIGIAGVIVIRRQAGFTRATRISSASLSNG
jgi:hypothetical protein